MDSRSHVIPIRFTDAELSEVRRVARERAISVSAVVRLRTTGQPLPPTVLPRGDLDALLVLSQATDALNGVVHKVAYTDPPLSHSQIDRRLIIHLETMSTTLEDIRRMLYADLLVPVVSVQEASKTQRI